MKPTIGITVLLWLLVLNGCASPSPTVQPIVGACPELPAPPAWVMELPPTQTSTQRLRNAFSGSLLMTSER